MLRWFRGTLSHTPTPEADACIAEHQRTVCRNVWLWRVRCFSITVGERRGGRMSANRCRLNVWGTHHKGRKDRKDVVALTLRPLRWNISWKLYFNRHAITGSTHQHPRPPGAGYGIEREGSPGGWRRISDNVLRIKEVAKGNLWKSLISLLFTVKDCRKSDKIGTFQITSISKTLCYTVPHLFHKLKCLEMWAFPTISIQKLLCVTKSLYL